MSHEVHTPLNAVIGFTGLVAGSDHCLHERLIVQAAGALAQDAAQSAIAHDAHALNAMSGTLGFERLFLACRSLRTAITGNERIGDCLSRAKAACVEEQAWKLSG